MRNRIAFLLLLTLASCEGNAVTNFNKLLEDFWQWKIQDSPEIATSIGEDKYNDKVTSYNITVYAERKDKVDEFLAALNEINPASLDKANQITYDIFKDALTTYTSGYKWFDYGTLNPVNFLEGFQTDPSYISRSMPFKTKVDFENYLTRLELTELRLKEQIELFDMAIAGGKTMHAVSMNRVPGQIDKILEHEADPTQFVLYGPFTSTLGNTTGISDADKALLRSRAEEVILNNVILPYKDFKLYLENTYMQNTRPGLGVGTWPNGQEFYKACLKWHLSVDTTADEIHALGLSQVERISNQMLKIIRAHNFEGTIKEYFDMLKVDPRFKLASGDEILQAYRDIVDKTVDPELSKFFDNIPDLPLVVMPMPNDGPGGAYSSGSADGSRPGTFWVNVIRVNDTNTFDMMALTLHEANPGHHMQLSHALLLDFPYARKRRYSYGRAGIPFNFPGYTSYTEGWGLYAEFLGEEMQLYRDDYELLGRYSGEIYRACRLVVDTGLHAKGWTREQAIGYMMNYTSASREDIEVEIDRYVTWPGQATAYKFGEIKILELRKKAESELGGSFNLKRFHDVVLGLAAVPLRVLEDAVNEMIEQIKDETQRASALIIQSSPLVVFLSALIMLLTNGQ